MPLYEYRCTGCTQGFSKLARRVSSGDETSPVCPNCGSTSERKLSSFAYHRSISMQLEQLDPRIEREMDHVDTMKDDPLSRLNMDFPSSHTD